MYCANTLGFKGFDSYLQKDTKLEEAVKLSLHFDIKERIQSITIKCSPAFDNQSELGNWHFVLRYSIVDFKCN